jgi:hypothetical protein
MTTTIITVTSIISLKGMLTTQSARHDCRHVLVEIKPGHHALTKTEGGGGGRLGRMARNRK